MKIIHVYLTNTHGNAKIYTFDYDDGKESLSSEEIRIEYQDQKLEDVLEELAFNIAEENMYRGEDEK